MGPGTHDGHLKLFGTGVIGGISMGSKYEFKADKNPGAGTYNPEASTKYFQTKIVGVIIGHQEGGSNHFLEHKQHGNPGAYHKNEDFNRLTANVTMGSKY